MTGKCFRRPVTSSSVSSDRSSTVAATAALSDVLTRYSRIIFAGDTTPGTLDHAAHSFGLISLSQMFRRSSTGQVAGRPCGRVRPR